MAIAAPATGRVVEIDGSELASDIDGQLESASVDDRLQLPDMFVLQFRDPKRDVLERAGIEIGTKVAISTMSVRGDTPESLVKGEVTSIEVDYDSVGSITVVRGYDLSHRLNAGRMTATFQNVKLSDIASQIAGDAGLGADVDDSGAPFEHVLQANESNLQFLYGMAKRIGFDCRVDDETLRFKKPTESSSGPGEGDFQSDDPVQLVWNGNLLEFHARMSAVAQVSQVKVRGWDVDKKEAVIGQADVAATNAELTTTPAALARKVGEQVLVVVDRPVGTQEAADALAAAQAEQVGSSAYEATAVVLGSPALKAGVAVSISGVDAALAGKWVVSASRHQFGSGPYKTHLEFSGRQDRSLLGLVANGTSGGASAISRIPGVAVAVVTNNEDPADQGRVKVKYPWLSDDAESFWARLATLGGGNDYGAVWIPQVGDEVVVAFQHGDVSAPIVVGSLWNGKDLAPHRGGGMFDAGTVKRSGFVSRKGHKFIFFDADDESGIALISADSKLKVSLNETKGHIKITADGKLIIEANELELKTTQNASIEATGQLKIKGATVAIN
jgi:phage protein D